MDNVNNGNDILQHGSTPWGRVSSYWIILAVVGLWLGTQAPEKVYNRAWEAMRTKHYNEAAADFLKAFERRKPPAKKEEALFWLAKANELAGDKKEASKRYRKLVDNYHGYWVPESLYTQVLLENEAGNNAASQPLAARLREEYPNSAWTRKLVEMK